MALKDTNSGVAVSGVAATSMKTDTKSAFNPTSEDMEWITKYYGSVENYYAVEEINFDDEGISDTTVTNTNITVQDGKIVAEVVNEDGSKQSIIIGNVEDLNGMVITADMINFDHIAQTANDAMNGNFVSITTAQAYWGDSSTMTVQVNPDGSVLILEGNVPMGWTTVTDLAIAAHNNGMLHSTELTDGGYVVNLDGSIDYMVAGEVIHIEEGDIFTDENGNKFIITTDENGDIRGIIIFDGNGKASGLNPSEAKNFLEILSSGDYLQTSDGSLVYRSGDNFHVVDGGQMFEVNGQQFFVSRIGSDGSPSSVIFVGEDKVSGYDADSFFKNLQEPGKAIVSNNGTVVYRHTNGELKMLDGNQSFEIDDQRYFVTNINDVGEITGMWTVDENGNLKELSTNNADELNSVLEKIENTGYLVNENGDIVYKDSTGTRCIPSADLVTDANGNKVWEGNHGTNIIFDTDGNISTEMRPITEIITSESPVDTSESVSSDSSMRNSQHQETINTHIDLAEGFTGVKIDNNVQAVYNADGNLTGIEIDGKQYSYNLADNTYVYSDGQNIVTFNGDGSFKSLMAEGYLVSKGTDGVLRNLMNNENMAVPSEMASLCNDITVGEIPGSIVVPEVTIAPDFAASVGPSAQDSSPGFNSIAGSAIGL